MPHSYAIPGSRVGTVQGFNEYGGNFEVRKVRTVADLVSPGFTLKVDGVVLQPSDKFPSGQTYEIVEITEIPFVEEDSATDAVDTNG